MAPADRGRRATASRRLPATRGRPRSELDAGFGRAERRVRHDQHAASGTDADDGQAIDPRHLDHFRPGEGPPRLVGRLLANTLGRGDQVEVAGQPHFPGQPVDASLEPGLASPGHRCQGEEGRPQREHPRPGPMPQEAGPHQEESEGEEEDHRRLPLSAASPASPRPAGRAKMVDVGLGQPIVQANGGRTGSRIGITA